MKPPVIALPTPSRCFWRGGHRPVEERATEPARRALEPGSDEDCAPDRLPCRGRDALELDHRLLRALGDRVEVRLELRLGQQRVKLLRRRVAHPVGLV
jgi:hypothetical protein